MKISKIELDMVLLTPETALDLANALSKETTNLLAK